MKIPKKKNIKKIQTVKNKKVIKSHEMEMLEKIEQRISLNVDSFLILSEEGEPTQVALAFQKAKKEFSECGPEMNRLAQKLGGDLPIIVAEFLESIETVLHGQGMLDEDLITHCLDNLARLKTEIYQNKTP